MKKPEDIARKIAETRNKKDAEDGKKGKRPVIMANMETSEPQKAPSIPEITENDLNFAKSLLFEYKKIPFEPLCQLVRVIRHDLNKYPAIFAADMLSMDFNFWDKLCSDDIEFKAITIESNKGQISIPASSPIFEYYFLLPLKRLKTLHIKVNTKEAKNNETSLPYILFLMVWRFFNRTDLGPQQKRVSTGMILQHFSLFGLTAQAIWKPNDTYGTYKEYLNDRIKKLLKSISL